MGDYTIEAVESRPFDQNAYLVWRNGAKEALVIDPGFDAKSMLNRIAAHGLRVAAILNTHGHVDHIAGNHDLKCAFPEAPLVIGRNEAALLGDPNLNLSARHGFPITSPSADRLVSEGERLDFADLSFEVREIPGHSPGSVVFVCSEFDPPFVFGGDVLFAGSIGRTDMGGDLGLLLSGIRDKLFMLPDATVVYPGHGPSTTVGEEKRTNPFAGELAQRTRSRP